MVLLALSGFGARDFVKPAILVQVPSAQTWPPTAARHFLGCIGRLGIQRVKACLLHASNVAQPFLSRRHGLGAGLSRGWQRRAARSLGLFRLRSGRASLCRSAPGLGAIGRCRCGRCRCGKSWANPARLVRWTAARPARARLQMFGRQAQPDR
jgi:hypothetical protein